MYVTKNMLYLYIFLLFMSMLLNVTLIYIKGKNVVFKINKKPQESNAKKNKEIGLQR